MRARKHASEWSSRLPTGRPSLVSYLETYPHVQQSLSTWYTRSPAGQNTLTRPPCFRNTAPSRREYISEGNVTRGNSRVHTREHEPKLSSATCYRPFREAVRAEQIVAGVALPLRRAPAARDAPVRSGAEALPSMARSNAALVNALPALPFFRFSVERIPRTSTNVGEKNVCQNKKLLL